MSKPLVTLYCVVAGEIYERYADDFLADACEFFLPEDTELVVLPGKVADGGADWSYTSATRYRVMLEHPPEIRGDWIFQADVDMRIVKPVGRDILADGIVVTTHPGFPPGDPNQYPYERRIKSAAYVPMGSGTTYHPGAFVGGRRKEFLAMARYIADAVDRDVADGTRALWYEESYLNRYLIDFPPALVLDERYCGWQNNTVTADTIIVHLNKSAEEFEARG